MKHAISIYIDDESEIIGFCGSIVVETDYDKAITCFNFNKDQLKANDALYIGQNGQGMLINKGFMYLERYRERCCDKKGD